MSSTGVNGGAMAGAGTQGQQRKEDVFDFATPIDRSNTGEGGGGGGGVSLDEELKHTLPRSLTAPTYCCSRFLRMTIRQTSYGGAESALKSQPLYNPEHAFAQSPQAL